MSKKLILVLAALLVLGSGSIFALGIGPMSSNTAGYGAVTYAPSRGGLYYGLGWGYYGLGFSAEKNLVSGNIIDADVFAFGYQLGLGANVGLEFVNTFSIGAGVYGLLGVHFDINVIPSVGIEIFGQWQPNIYMSLLPSFGFGSGWWGGYASGVRFWF